MIVAGFGYRSGATVESLSSALAATGFAGDLTALATAQDKSALVHELGQTLGLATQAIPAEELTQVQTPTQSAASLSHRKTGSVAEASALVAAGPRARLIVKRAISHDRLATCAIASGDTP